MIVSKTTQVNLGLYVIRAMKSRGLMTMFGKANTFENETQDPSKAVETLL